GQADAARAIPSLLASANHGRPHIAATARPGVFQGRGTVAASDSGGRSSPHAQPANAMFRPSSGAAGNPPRMHPQVSSPLSQAHAYPTQFHAAPTQSRPAPAQYHAPPAQVHAAPAQYHAPPAQSRPVPAQYHAPPAQFHAAPAQYHAPPAQFPPAPAQYHAPPPQFR